MTEKDLEPALLRRKFGENDFLNEFRVFEELDSTNEYLKREIENLTGNTLIIALAQNAGKGSKGRNWDSPAGSGIWMSFLIRPDIPAVKAPMLTLVIALSIAKAMRVLYNIPVQIKWPNDIVCNGKKLCGILTEMKKLSDGSYGVVIGMGINVNTESFPQELLNKATSVYIETGKKSCRADLVAAVIDNFSNDYKSFLQTQDLSLLLREYSHLSATVGKPVRVMDLKGEYTATAISVGSDGCLLVQCEDGQTKKILGDEVSVRGIYGYI